jgi:hypothetical protein
MKRRLLALAVLMATLCLSLSKPAAALRNNCYEENYGGGNCGTTCVYYNDQGSVSGWETTIHKC